MKKSDLQDVLALVKEKLSRDPEAACGVFWTDEAAPGPDPTSRYAVGEEDATTRYAVGEEDGSFQ